MKSIREDLIRFVHETGNEKLIKEIEQLVYRPVSEVYIPLPDSKHFHEERPDFLVKILEGLSQVQVNLYSQKKNGPLSYDFIIR